MAISFQALAEKIRLTREEIARLNNETITAPDDKPAELSVVCRMSFSVQDDGSQRWFLPKDLRAVVEENFAAS